MCERARYDDRYFVESRTRTLAEFAASNVLVGFDFDGTLAPTVTEPARAELRRSTSRLLAHAARRYPSIVVSGRAREDVVKRLRRVPLWQVFGNHGAEPWGGEMRTRRLE